jgi:hypothetical protein
MVHQEIRSARFVFIREKSFIKVSDLVVVMAGGLQFTTKGVESAGKISAGLAPPKKNLLREIVAAKPVAEDEATPRWGSKMPETLFGWGLFIHGLKLDKKIVGYASLFSREPDEAGDSCRRSHVQAAGDRLVPHPASPLHKGRDRRFPVGTLRILLDRIFIFT